MPETDFITRKEYEEDMDMVVSALEKIKEQLDKLTNAEPKKVENVVEEKEEEVKKETNDKEIEAKKENDVKEEPKKEQIETDLINKIKEIGEKAGFSEEEVESYIKQISDIAKYATLTDDLILEDMKKFLNKEKEEEEVVKEEKEEEKPLPPIIEKLSLSDLYNSKKENFHNHLKMFFK